MRTFDFKMKTGKVYSYLRFSDSRQAAGHSAERQTEYARKWAAENNMELDEALTMRDEGLSAFHQMHVKNGAFGIFLAAINAGKIQPGSVLIVEDLDRLSRAEPLLAQAQLSQIISADISVITPGDGKIYNRDSLKANPIDLIYSLVKMIRAYEESETKSKRVTAAIRRMCDGWVAGTFRGRIRNGADPAWARWNGKEFEFVPERAEAFRVAIDLFIQGFGNVRIDRALRERGLTLMAKSDIHAYYTVFRRHDLIGVRTFTVDGEQFRLDGYYPALIDAEKFARLQLAIESRKGKPRSAGGKSEIPSIFTGLRVLRCGHCGSTLVSQNLTNRKRKPDGSILDGHRRLRCSGNGANPPQHESFSCSAIPLERAILTYCSDQLNLESLLAGNDRTAELRVEKAALLDRRASLEKQIEKILDAALSEGNSLPQALLRRAKAFEEEIMKIQERERLVDAELLTSAKIGNAVDAEVWGNLKQAVFDNDYDARIRCRALIGDTFSKIIVYFRGTMPATTSTRPKHLDVMLISHSGVARLIRVDKKTGEWIAGAEVKSFPNQGVIL